MRLLDVNLLVRTHREDAPDHVDYREWLSEALVADEPVAVTTQVLVSSDRDFARFEGLRWSRPLT